MLAKRFGSSWLLLLLVASLVLAACGGDTASTPAGTDQGASNPTEPPMPAAEPTEAEEPATTKPTAAATTAGATEAATAGATMAATAAATSEATGAAGDASGRDAARFPLEGGTNSITAAGASFPAPLYSRWFEEYNRQYNVKVNYQSIGSGGGIEQLTAGTVAFGASDRPMTDEEIQAAGGDVLHIPMTLGAVAVTYNLEGLQEPLILDGPTTARIFLGNITNWNDPAIAKLNPNTQLPDQDIAVVRRSDGSGTTFIFASWLAANSPEWESQVGADSELDWPTGFGAQGNEGVAAQVGQVPGAIGYNEIAYAIQNDLQYAALVNSDGEAVLPELANISAAAEGAAANFDPDLRVSLINAEGANSYPASSFTWVLVNSEQEDEAVAKAIVNVLWWGIHEGQNFSEDLDYARLSDAVVRLNEEQLRKITVNGEPVIPEGQ